MAFLRRKATCDYSDKKNFRGKFKKTLEKTRQNKKCNIKHYHAALSELVFEDSL